MNNTLEFNHETFVKLLKDDKPTLNQILTVLNQTSDISRRMTVNHNCLIADIPFTWKYKKLYEADMTIRVLTVPFHKISTGFDFFLDIEETGELYLSQGKGTRRTPIVLSMLMALRPTVQRKIFNIINFVCREHTEQELFDFYKSFEDCEYCDIPDVPYTWYDEYREEVFALQTINNAYQITSYGKNGVVKSHYEAIEQYPESYHDHFCFAGWCKEHECWYADIIFAIEPWHIDGLRDPGSYHIDMVNGKAKVLEPEDSLPDALKNEMEALVQNIVDRATTGDCLEEAKTGAWFGFRKDDDYIMPVRCWSAIPECSKVPFYVKVKNQKNYYLSYDLRELDLRENGDVEFKSGHTIAEEY